MNKETVVLVTGADGQLGHALRLLNRQNNNQDNIKYIFADKSNLNICNKNTVLDFLNNQKIDCIINAAAYTNVNQAHADADLAMDVNGAAPGLLANICNDMGIRLFHISSDYVFDGEKIKPYTEEDLCNPINTYGATKLSGEKAIVSLNTKAVIIRTSWVFSQWGDNFANSILNAASKSETIQLVSNQTGGPTWAMHLAELIHKLITIPAEHIPAGIYNFSGYPFVSWYDFAREIIYRAKDTGLLTTLPKLIPINAEQWPSTEPRPLNSKLDNSKLMALFYNINAELKQNKKPRLFHSVHIPFNRNWRAGIDAVVTAYKGNS